MKPIFVAILLVHALSGCAVITVTSVASTITTDKSLTDHAVSGITQHDCSTLRALTGERDFYCERARESGTTYNRNSY
jgi:hypothetical protein